MKDPFSMNTNDKFAVLTIDKTCGIFITMKNGITNGQCPATERRTKRVPLRCRREEEMSDLTEKIQRLKKENNAVICAHYYVEDEVQEIADYIGDSYYLAQIASKLEEDVIVFCGVSFMGESAKILNPEKTVLLPDMDADCPMAHMADPETVQKMREEYEDLAVVCYVNSDAALKACSDVCVTSANALKIVKNLPNKNIYFIPDQHLASYIAEQVPEKNILICGGYCPVHHGLSAQSVKREMERHPGAKVLVHPECPAEVVALADYTGSTSGILAYAKKSEAQEFVICTEKGVFYQLEKQNPGKHFYMVGAGQCCAGMKQVTLQKIADALENRKPEVSIEENLRERAWKPLQRMLELS